MRYGRAGADGCHDFSLRVDRRSLVDDRNSLNFDQHVWIREARDGDCSARRKIRPKDLRSNFGHPRRVSRIGQKHRHGDDIFQGGAGLFQRCFNIAEGLINLRFKIAGKRLAGIVFLTGYGRRSSRFFRPR
ncbi:MAG: hypothetical protein WDN50_11905 [Bradyrhizobium sp.]